MEVNKEEAIRCLHIAQRHRGAANLSSALRFAKKSVALFPTPEGEAMISVVQTEIEAAGAGASSSSGSTPTTAKSTGVEEHITSARDRKRAPAAEKEKENVSEKKTYTAKHVEVVKRVKRCRHHEYYEILSIERTCTENEVKKAYKKLALALHPDKNNAPGADEAFKMVSKAFQILSDKDLRAAYDSNPTVDPTQRGGGGGGGFSSMRRGGGGMPPGYQRGGFQGDINPEDLFNMFFGGGMGMDQGGFGGGFGGPRVYTFGGGGHPFVNARRARQQAAGGDTNTSPFAALLPIILLAFFIIFSIIPTLLSDQTPAPGFNFAPTNRYTAERATWSRHVKYYVNQPEFEASAVWQSVPEQHRKRKDAAMFSSKLRGFERSVEETHIRQLQQDCQYFNSMRQRRIQEEAGFFGIGADYDKIKKLRAQTHPSCEQLRKWGVSQQSF